MIKKRRYTVTFFFFASFGLWNIMRGTEEAAEKPRRSARKAGESARKTS
ncbi:hypothetical protein [Niallia sp. 03133]